MGRLNSMKGGGFLNNVDGTIVDYEIRNSFPGEPADDSDDADIFVVLSVQQDGQVEAVTTTMRAGSSAFTKIRDSHTLVNPEGSLAKIWDKSDLYNFLQSVEKAGLKDGGIDETDADVLSFGGLVNQRFRFVQKPDEGRMAARKASGNNPMRVDEKTGKEYPFTRLEVETYYGAGATTAPAKPVGAGKTAGAAKAGNGAVKATGATNGNGSLDAEASAVLRRLLDANGGSIQRSQIAMLVTKAEQANPNREALRKRIWSEDFLTNASGIEFDRAGKTQEIRLVA